MLFPRATPLTPGLIFIFQITSQLLPDWLSDWPACPCGPLPGSLSDTAITSMKGSGARGQVCAGKYGTRFPANRAGPCSWWWLCPEHLSSRPPSCSACSTLTVRVVSRLQMTPMFTLILISKNVNKPKLFLSAGSPWLTENAQNQTPCASEKEDWSPLWSPSLLASESGNCPKLTA